jgi:uncharacterized RDD family membrane protein YckC
MATTTNNPPPEPADIARRILAAVIDIAVIIVVFVLYAMVFGETEATSDDDSTGFTVNLEGNAALGFAVLAFLYYFALEAIFGKTPGKTFTGLRVVALDNRSLPPKVLLRTLLRVIDGLPVFYLLGFVVMVTNKDRRRIGDLASGTMVTRA